MLPSQARKSIRITSAPPFSSLAIWLTEGNSFRQSSPVAQEEQHRDLAAQVGETHSLPSRSGSATAGGQGGSWGTTCIEAKSGAASGRGEKRQPAQCQTTALSSAAPESSALSIVGTQEIERIVHDLDVLYGRSYR
jgi:hypothetical protein